jgi:hypothetical protein
MPLEEKNTHPGSGSSLRKKRAKEKQEYRLRRPTINGYNDEDDDDDPKKKKTRREKLSDRRRRRRRRRRRSNRREQRQ